MIRIIIKGGEHVQRSKMAYQINRLLTEELSNKIVSPSYKKEDITIHDQPGRWKRKPYQCIPKILIRVKQRTGA